MQAVVRARGAGALPAVAQRAVEIHPNLAPLLIHMHIRRGDVRIDLAALHPRGHARIVQVERIGAVRKGRLLEAQRPWLVHPPGALQRVGAGQPNVSAVVVGEVEQVAPRRVGQPLGRADQRGTVDVRPHPRVHMGPDDRAVAESPRSHHAPPMLMRDTLP